MYKVTKVSLIIAPFFLNKQSIYPFCCKSISSTQHVDIILYSCYEAFSNKMVDRFRNLFTPVKTINLSFKIFYGKFKSHLTDARHLNDLNCWCNLAICRTLNVFYVCSNSHFL